MLDHNSEKRGPSLEYIVEGRMAYPWATGCPVCLC